MSRPRIMVVEDEVVSAESLKMTLKEFGYDPVALVTSGEVAVRKAAELEPDLVIMDISLAGQMDGAQAALQIRTDHGIPIIFLTAYADDHHLEKARRAEPYAFLIKPFNNRELKAAIETALYKAAMEERLRRSEERLDITLRSIGDAVITTDPQGRIEYLNEMARNLTGWSPDEAKGRPIGEIFRIEGEDPAGLPEDPAAMASSLGGAAGQANEAVFIDRTGRNIPIDHSAAPILDRQGRAAGIVLVFRDVTERKQAQEALAQSEAALRSLFRAAPIGIGLVKDRILGWTNERFNTITGYSREELEGQNARILYPNDEEYERVGNIQIPQVRRFGRSAIETRMRRKDGRLLDVLLSSASLIPTDNSTGFVFTILDVTEQKLAEAALRDSEERYRALVETIPHGVQEIEAEGRILYSNQVLSDLLGYRPEELAGRMLYDLCDGEGPRRTLKNNLELIVREQPRLQPFETRLLTRDGRAIEAKIDWNYKRDPEGGLAGLISIVTDVTRQKELEAQLQRARKMQAIGTLAGGIAHDFNNILAAIMGYTELSIFELPENMPARKNLERVLESGQRAKRLIQQILDFSRPTDKGRIPIDTCQVISEALNLLTATLPAHIELVRNFHPDAGHTLADPTQLHQLVMNLCTNAVQALKECGGKIEVAVEQVYLDEESSKDFVGLAPGPYQKITVRDSGPGMTREILDRIFEPFFTTRKTGQGVGLGLSVVHGIVKGHGGAIVVRSQPGAGAEFSVLLPMTSPAEDEGAPAYVERSLPTGTESILFVDDEEALVDLAGHALERLGYRFTGAYSGEEALEYFRESPAAFDLVITDQNMPGLKGADVAREMLALRPDLPIVMYTGYADSITAEMALKMGFQHFLSKPILAREIAYAIRRILDGS